MRNRTCLSWGTAMIVVLVSCARAPEKEVTEVMQALDQARVAEADLYASQTFQEAEDTLASAQAEIEVQSEKSIVSRSYDEAKQLLESAKQAAHRALYEASSGREQARLDAKAAIKDARAALESAGASVAKARPGKGTQADLEAIKVDLEALQTVLTEAESDFEAGNYIEAQNKAEVVLAEAGSIGQDMGNALKKAT